MDDMYQSFVDAGFLYPDPATAAAPTAVDSSGFGMSGVSSFLNVGSSILGAYGQLLSGKQKAGADEYNAQLALDAGSISLQELEGAEEEVLSTQKAMYAKAGVAMSGSPLDAA